MIKSRFEELIKTLNAQNTLKGVYDNAVIEASKLLEINYTMRQVDQELEFCKSAIIEHLKYNEIATVTLTRLEIERNKIAASHENFNDFAENTRLRMIKIEEARNNFHTLLNYNEDDREFDAQCARELGEAIQKVNEERKDLLNDLETIGQSIESFETELKDITTCMRLQKTENAVFHATLVQKRKDIINHYRISLSRHDELLKLKNRNEEGSVIKVETKEEGLSLSI